jgi:hypothetical protein
VKEYLYGKIMDFVRPIQAKYHKITDKEISDLLAKNAKIANKIAEKKIQTVYEKIGFTLK